MASFDSEHRSRGGFGCFLSVFLPFSLSLTLFRLRSSFPRNRKCGDLCGTLSPSLIQNSHSGNASDSSNSCPHALSCLIRRRTCNRRCCIRKLRKFCTLRKSWRLKSNSGRLSVESSAGYGFFSPLFSFPPLTHAALCCRRLCSRCWRGNSTNRRNFVAHDGAKRRGLMISPTFSCIRTALTRFLSVTQRLFGYDFPTLPSHRDTDIPAGL